MATRGTAKSKKMLAKEMQVRKDIKIDIFFMTNHNFKVRTKQCLLDN